MPPAYGILDRVVLAGAILSILAAAVLAGAGIAEELRYRARAKREQRARRVELEVVA